MLTAALLGCGQADPATGGRALAQSPAAEEPAMPDRSALEHPFSHRVAAPSLEGATEWVNVAEPIELVDLRGRFVLLDFWTYCCINCIHVLPEIKQLERAYPTELIVIGVHSAKFDGEQDSRNIHEAAMRYEIEHPIVNDAEMAIWRRYGARSWPTLVLIDPAGEIVWAASGERKFADMQAILERGLPYYRAQGVMKPAPRPEILIGKPWADTPLRFPGKVLADETGGRLLISDSNHNRIVVASLDGQFQFAIGSGQIGQDDGEFAAASFNHPQGTALVGDVLYVADTENHLLRKADLVGRRVTTVAGTGEQGSGWPKREAATAALLRGDGWPVRFVGPPGVTALASPWALWPHGDDLYIAMAGPHQIWKMRLDESEIGVYAGNGREDIRDGRPLPPTPYAAGYASLAQPSGLASDGTRLFVADSEGSAVRSVPFDPEEEVETIVGLQGTLFDFGDVDGRGRDVRLQHPLGVAWFGGRLYVADTYNNKIKVIDVDEARCQTIAGTGASGIHDAAEGLQATFNEPSGLAAAAGKLYVADTNNHAIRIVELAPPHRVSTLVLDGLTPPEVPAP